MKHLLYYDTTSAYTAEQWTAGGNGRKVVSVVDGVAWCEDSGDTYYRYAPPSQENLTSYTITIHYKTVEGETINPDTSIQTTCYIGKSTRECLFSKNIEGYRPLCYSETLWVSQDTDYTFFYSTENINLNDLYLTFLVYSGGNIMWRNDGGNGYYVPKTPSTIQYSKNGGEWVSITSNSAHNETISVQAGDVVRFKGNNAKYSFVGYGPSDDEYYSIYSFGYSSAGFDLMGNIMSMIGGDNFSNLTSFGSDDVFIGFFKACNGLRDASKLLLPATTVTSKCYDNMFFSCIGLTTAPELPATRLGSQCYDGMFYNCRNLTTAPTVLPSTALTYKCYYEMFRNCSNLISAPELPATTLTNYCYSYMFYGCTKLNYVKCMAENNIESYNLTSWLYDVSSEGKFVKNANATAWTTGTSGIPTGWTVVDDTN